MRSFAPKESVSQDVRGRGFSKVFDKHAALNGEKLLLVSRTRQRCLFSWLLSNIVLEVLREEGIKSIQMERDNVKLSMFAEDVILYREEPRDVTKRLLKPISTVEGYKVYLLESFVYQ